MENPFALQVEATESKMIKAEPAADPSKAEPKAEPKAAEHCEHGVSDGAERSARELDDQVEKGG